LNPNIGNADLINPYGNGTYTFTVTLTGITNGAYYPFRFIQSNSVNCQFMTFAFLIGSTWTTNVSEATQVKYYTHVLANAPGWTLPNNLAQKIAQISFPTHSWSYGKITPDSYDIRTVTLDQLIETGVEFAANTFNDPALYCKSSNNPYTLIAMSYFKPDVTGEWAFRIHSLPPNTVTVTIGDPSGNSGTATNPTVTKMDRSKSHLIYNFDSTQTYTITVRYSAGYVGCDTLEMQVSRPGYKGFLKFSNPSLKSLFFAPPTTTTV
jgi:hypothetical protein